jgi:hypothetical protein
MLQFENIRKCEKFYHNGVALLYCDFSYPKIQSCDSFFSEICESCLTWANEKLFPRLCDEYDNNTDSKKRFTKGYEYRVSITSKDCTDGYAECVFLAAVNKRDSRETWYKDENTFVIRLKDGIIISPKIAKRVMKQNNFIIDKSEGI